MDVLLLVANTVGGWLSAIPVRPLIEFAGIIVGLLLIVRLNLVAQNIKRATAAPRALRAEVMNLHIQIEQLSNETAKSHSYAMTPAQRTAALSIYRDD